jgi:hypothetical protein
MKPTYTLKDNTYSAVVKDNPADKIEVEVGDSKQVDFKPQVKIMRWDNEVNFSMRAEEKAGATVQKDGDVIKYITPEYEVHQYDKPEVSEDGGFEFEWVLKEPPTTNVLTATIQTKGLDFFYQPELTAQEKAQGSIRPDNVIGSYAVYHKTMTGNYVGGKEYKCGKAFHIYRPEAIDSKGNKTWCDLHLDEASETLTVTVNQKWLDKATYPVIVDPTFGYTTGGASYHSSNEIKASHFTPVSTGTVTGISSYQEHDVSSTQKIEYALYADSSGSVGSKLTVDVYSRTAALANNIWLGAVLSYQITSGTVYWLATWDSPTGIDGGSGELNKVHYDTGSANAGLYLYSGSWGLLPDPITSPTYNNYTYSIFCTYWVPRVNIPPNSFRYVTVGNGMSRSEGAT